MALKFLGADGTGNTSDAVEAINYATKMRRDFGVNVAVLNNSWGGAGFSQSLLAAIRANRDAGALFVAAAGNDGTNDDAAPQYPAGYDVDNIISVAATDRNDRPAGFSNYGAASVDLAAPGVSVLSTLPTYATAAMQARGLPTGYGTLSGTSMAAPHVAGAAAVVWDGNPDATYARVRQSLLDNGDAVAALAGKTATGRRLNVARSFLAPPAPSLTAPLVVVDDAPAGGGTSGNGNGVINPGETVALAVTVRNVASVGTTGVTATLSLESPDPAVTITQATVAYGDVPGKGESAGPGRFLVRVDPSAATPHPVPFVLTIRDGTGRAWVVKLPKTVYTSSRETGRATVDGQPVAGATITYAGPAAAGSAVTGPDGAYALDLVDGTYTLTAAAPGAVRSAPVQATVGGRVTDSGGAAVAGATVGWGGDAVGSTTTGADGRYAFAAVAAGGARLTVYAARAGYAGSSARSITVPPGQAGVDLVLSSLRYTLTDLGRFDDFGRADSNFVADAGATAVVNNAGAVAGAFEFYADPTRDGPGFGVSRAFSWAAGTLAMLGAGDVEDRAEAVNDRGLVAGTSGGRAVVWDGGASATLAGVPDGASVAAVDNAGRVVGAAVGDVYVWERSSGGSGGAGTGTVRYLGLAGRLPGEISAADANDAGQVVGNYYAASNPSPYRGFLWDASRFVDLGSTVPAAVNGSGDVAGWAPAATTGGPSDAVVWRNGAVTRLPRPNAQDRDMAALDVNDAGVVVGRDNTFGDGDHAFVYLNGTAYDLNGLLAQTATGWKLREAQSVNSAGQIAGWGTRPDGTVGVFLLTPADAGPPNYAPKARDVQAGTLRNRPKAVSLRGFDPDLDPLRYTIVAGPAHGALSGDADGDAAVTYTPDPAYAGVDTFTYKVNDGRAHSPTGTARIVVNAGYRVVDLPGVAAALDEHNEAAGGSGANFVWRDGLSTSFQGLDYVIGLNDAGAVVGGAPGKLAAVYDQGAVRIYQGPFVAGRGYGINNLGHVAGSSPNPLDREQQHAVFWRDASSYVNLGSFGTARNLTDYAWGEGLNDADTVVGWSFTDEVIPGSDEAVVRAFVRSGSGAMAPIPGLGGVGSAAYAVSNSGLITGFVRHNLSSREAFVYSPAAGVTILPSLGTQAFGRDVNDAGTVVGLGHNGQYTAEGAPVMRGFVYQNGVTTDLGDLLVDSTIPITDAYEVNDNGWIVATTQNAFGTTFGVLLVPATDDPAPTADAQTVTTTEDTAKPVTLTAAAPGGHKLTYLLVQPPAHGTVSDFANGPGLTYTPAADYAGADSLTFRVYDAAAGRYSAPAAVNLTVTPVNDPPVATNGSGLALRNGSVTVTMPATDADGSPLTWTVVSGPAHGVLSAQSGGSIKYTPAAGFVGHDSFTFRASDGQVAGNVATVNLLVHPGYSVTFLGNPPNKTRSFPYGLNDLGDVVGMSEDPNNGKWRPFVWRPGTGMVDLGTSNPDTTRNGEAVDINNAGQIVGRYATPADMAGFVWAGGVSRDLNLPGFFYDQIRINNRGETAATVPPDSSAAVVSYFRDHNGTWVGAGALGVSGLNDLGQVLGSPATGNGPPLIWQDGRATPVALQGSHAAPGAIGNDGLAVLKDAAGRVVKYDPATGQAGTVVDPSNRAAPVAVNARGQVVELSEVAGAAGGFVRLWSDGVLLDVNALIPVGTGTLDNVFDINNVGQITARLNGNAVLLTPNPFTNAAPSAPAAAAASTAEEAPVTVPLAGADADGDAITYVLSVPPQHGSVTLRGATLVYTPDRNYAGPDAIRYRATDGFALSADATVSVTVDPVNDAPAAAPQTVRAFRAAPTPITLAATDPEGSPVTYSIATGPAHGTLSAAADGDNQVVYRPADGFTGVDTFSFRGGDGSLQSPPATVTVVVTPAYTYVDLGTLGGTTSSAAGINNGGQVVGSATNAAGKTRAFLWQSGAMLDLGTFGGATAYATAINALGQVVGQADLPTNSGVGYIWEDGRMRPLTAANGKPIEPYALTNDGLVVGKINSDPFGYAAPYTWRDGTSTPLATTATKYAYPRGVNAAGLIAGQLAQSPLGTSSARLWRDGTMVPLDGMPNVDDKPYAINDAGQVVGQSRLGPTAGTRHAFAWQSGVWTDLGSLGGPTASSSALAVNNAGVVVGSSETAPGVGSAAFLWQGGLLISLADLVGGGAGGLPAGVGLLDAAGVNDRGQIVGRARTAAGQTHAYLLTPTNAAPALTAVAPLAGPAAAGRPFTITYAALAAAADESDADGGPVSFRVDAVAAGGTLLADDGAPAVPGTTFLSPGQSLVWTPPAAAAGPTEAFRVSAWDGRLSSAPPAVPVTVVVSPAGPAVASVGVNDGSAIVAQRSMVRGLTVTFDRPVTLDAGTFTLAGRGGAGGAGVTLSWSDPAGDGRTWALTFAGPAVVGGSLPDGVYDLTVHAAAVHGGPASGPAMASDYAFAFHRLFSDADGDGDSDNFDLLQLRPTLLKPSTDPAYKGYFDYNGSGVVDNLDVFQIRSRRGITFQGY